MGPALRAGLYRNISLVVNEYTICPTRLTSGSVQKLSFCGVRDVSGRPALRAGLYRNWDETYTEDNGYDPPYERVCIETRLGVSLVSTELQTRLTSGSVQKPQMTIISIPTPTRLTSGSVQKLTRLRQIVFVIDPPYERVCIETEPNVEISILFTDPPYERVCIETRTN